MAVEATVTDVGAVIRRTRRLLDERLKALEEERTELIRIKRILGEELDELTPVRPPSRTDMAAAFAAAGEYSEAATAALKKP